MTKEKNWSVKNGEKYSFVLDLNTGLFKISLNDSVLVKTMNMKEKKLDQAYPSTMAMIRLQFAWQKNYDAYIL